MPGRPMLAIASPAVIPLAVCIQSLAWVAVFLTIAAVWRVIQITRRGIESPWGILSSPDTLGAGRILPVF